MCYVYLKKLKLFKIWNWGSILFRDLLRYFFFFKLHASQSKTNYSYFLNYFECGSRLHPAYPTQPWVQPTYKSKVMYSILPLSCCSAVYSSTKETAPPQRQADRANSSTPAPPLPSSPDPVSSCGGSWQGGPAPSFDLAWEGPHLHRRPRCGYRSRRMAREDDNDYSTSKAIRQVP